MLSDLTNWTTGAGVIFLIGLLILVICGAAFYVLRGRGARMYGYGALVGFVIVIIAIAVAAVTVSSQSTTPVAPSTASVNVVENSGIGLPTGVTWNAQTDTLSVDVGYNYTGGFYTVAATNTTPTSGSHTFTQTSVTLPLSLIRTDAQNHTYLFPLQVTSVPTFSTIGTSPVTYSFVGYSVQTSTATSAWQMKWSAGTYAGQYSTVNAPGVTSNVLPNGLAVGSFSTGNVALGLTFAGANSTLAPTPWSTTLTQFQTLTMPVTIGQGTPATVYINLIWTGYSNK
jgi:hypothetical protein